MTFRTIAAIIASLLISAACFAQDEALQIEMANPGFEDGLNDWAIVHPDFTSADTEVAHSDAASLRLSDDAGASNAYVAQSVPDLEGGATYVIIKKGEHGALLFGRDFFFACPGFPLETVLDPTGAGDTFAGGFMGHIAKRQRQDHATLRQAIVHGSVVASFTCEAFGPDRVANVTPDDIQQRYQAFARLTAF